MLRRIAYGTWSTQLKKYGVCEVLNAVLGRIVEEETHLTVYI